MHWAKREKKPPLLKVRKADHPRFLLWRCWFHQSKARLCIFISCIKHDVEFFQLLQNSQLAILSLGLGKFTIELSQIVRRLLKRAARCQKIQYWKGKGNYSCHCIPPTDQKYLLATKRTKSYQTTNCPARSGTSHLKFLHPPTKVRINLFNHILPILISSKNAWWSQALTINIELMTSISTTLWFSL